MPIIDRLFDDPGDSADTDMANIQPVNSGLAAQLPLQSSATNQPGLAGANDGTSTPTIAGLDQSAPSNASSELKDFKDTMMEMFKTFASTMMQTQNASQTQQSQPFGATDQGAPSSSTMALPPAFQLEYDNIVKNFKGNMKRSASATKRVTELKERADIFETAINTGKEGVFFPRGVKPFRPCLDTEVHSSYEVVKDCATTLSFEIPKGVSRAAAMSLIAWHHAKFTTDIELEMAIASSAAISKTADPANLYEECSMAADEFVQVQKNTLGLHAPDPIEISRDAVRQKAKDSYRTMFNDLNSAPMESLGKNRSLKGPKSVLDAAPDNLLENLVKVAVAKIIAKTGLDPNVTVMDDTILPDMTASDFQILVSETFSESMEPYTVEYKDYSSKNYKASGSADPSKPYQGNKDWKPKTTGGKGKNSKAKSGQRTSPWMKDAPTDQRHWNSEASNDHTKPTSDAKDEARFVPPPTWTKVEEDTVSAEEAQKKNDNWLWDNVANLWTNKKAKRE
jgi:hypothetical protein